MNSSRFTASRITVSLRNRLYELACRYVLWRDRAYWKQLKGRYRGRRGWVIGNGPSLKVEDLDRLQGEVCIASNKIYLAFEQTKWRPTFLTVVDQILWPKIKDECLIRYTRIHLPHILFTPSLLLERKLVYWDSLPPAASYPGVDCVFATDVSRGMHGGCSVTFENLQLANYLGLNPIYVIGCDHYYAGEDDIKNKREVESKAANHFHPDYRRPGELVSPASIDDMNQAYEHARIFAENNGLKIYNATRGGHLDVFERRNFDQVLAHGSKS